MRQSLIAATVALALSAAVAPSSFAAQKKHAAKKGGGDSMFVTNAAKGGMAEVELGKMATEKASSDQVKQFGQRMMDDHSKANDELKSIADKKGVKLPSKEPSGKWSSDKAYMDMMVKDHEKDLAEFQEEASTGTDPDVKKFAEDTAKVVQEHLDLAKQTQSKLQ